MLLAKTLRSSTFRVALICIALFGAVVVILFGYVYSSTAAYVLNRSDRSIEADHADLIAAYNSGGRDHLVEMIDQLVSDNRHRDSIYLLTDPTFAALAGNLRSWPPALKGFVGWANFDTKDWKPNEVDRPQLRAIFEMLPGGLHLIVGKDVKELKLLARRIKFALVAAISLVFALAAVASVAVTRRTVGRIESINATTRAIMQSGLGRRVPLRGKRDEWDQLAGNLNLMLDRIEALMGEVKQVTDNVAHDLRTPLTRMRGRLEKASYDRREPERDQFLIGDTIADLDDVLRMFSSLTRISRIEATSRTAAFRTIDLVEIAQSVVELFDAAAEDKNVWIKVSGDKVVLIAGDRDLLFDALANLVDNAIKHGREAGQVAVTVTRSNGVATVVVSDDGPGIPIDEHQNIFKRFYRLERSRLTSGNGLGLNLVAAVARLHNARIESVDNEPGLKIELRFASADGPEEIGLASCVTALEPREDLT